MNTGQSFLEDTSADVVLFQELRVDGDRMLAAQREATRRKWSLAIEPGKRTDADSVSAGVGIAVRSHIGLARVPGLTPLDCWLHALSSHTWDPYARVVSISRRRIFGAAKGLRSAT